MKTKEEDHGSWERPPVGVWSRSRQMGQRSLLDAKDVASARVRNAPARRAAGERCRIVKGTISNGECAHEAPAPSLQSSGRAWRSCGCAVTVDWVSE